MKNLTSFTLYCKKHPKERFWQALRNWAGVGYILVTNTLDGGELEDTFYWSETKKHIKEL